MVAKNTFTGNYEQTGGMVSSSLRGSNATNAAPEVV